MRSRALLDAPHSLAESTITRLDGVEANKNPQIGAGQRVDDPRGVAAPDRAAHGRSLKPRRGLLDTLLDRLARTTGDPETAIRRVYSFFRLNFIPVVKLVQIPDFMHSLKFSATREFVRHLAGRGDVEQPDKAKA